MKLRVTLDRSGQQSVDVSVTFDSSATVGDVAEELYLADPTRSADTHVPEGLTLGVPGSRHATLDPASLFTDSGIRSGQSITISRAGERYADPRRQSAAVLVVVEGPDRGQEFGLASGSNVVGRGRACDVRLTDLMVSRQHVRINVSDRAEVIDLGSANGMSVNDAPAEREILQATDRVTVGDTTFSVRMSQGAATEGRAEATAVGFIRSPRLVKAYGGEKFKAPELPDPPGRQRFPILVLIAPILMAGVMYYFTHQAMTLLFMALSPLMMLGSYFENLIGGKATFKRASRSWREGIDHLVARFANANQIEVASRLIEHPSVAECVQAASELNNLLWTRRADSPGFAEFRLGLGAQPSRSSVELPTPKASSMVLFTELEDRFRPLATVHDVPVIASPARDGGLGIAGPRAASAGCARAVVVQAASLHSPEDLVIAAVASPRSAADWDWLKWLPHCSSSNSPLPSHLATSTAGAAGVLGAVEELIAERADAKPGAEVERPAILLLVESDAPVEFGRLVGIAENGWRRGVFVVWVAAELSQLPAACRDFVELRSSHEAMAGYLHTGDAVVPLTAETIGIEATRAWAKVISPVSDLAARSDDASDVPRSVNLLALPGFEAQIGPDHVIERWQANRSIASGPLAPAKPSGKAGNLRAVIGQGASGPHSLDLRTDGPHALVGGTTGSGKSELLQTWILAMAASHSPQRLNFLLVDYKGGSAFADCNKLPHTVGLVTDLNPNGVKRALTSLAAELRYRERVITEEHKAKDLQAMEKKFPALAPPSLVIVVDEFAALVQEVPEFIDGVINVAQRGRSLGLHMILATQQPSGVIKGALRANTNLRLALRVADVDDSNDVLGSPQAAYFDPDTPGRAVSKTGPGRLVMFQTGYVGGHTGQVAHRSSVVVEELVFGSGQVWERPAVEDEGPIDRGPADISRIVAAVQQAHDQAGLPTPRRPWLPDLKTHYDLADTRALPTRRSDAELVFGMADDPDNQAQLPVAFYPDVEGNLAVFGTGGSGKSTLLRTIAVAAGFAIRGGHTDVYGLDFGSRGLAMLEGVPNVGAIIPGSDEERVHRLVHWLTALVEERASRYAAVNAGTIVEYRRLSGRTDEKRILLLIDGMAALRSAFEGGQNQWVLDALTSIATSGRSVGVHVVVSSDRVNGIPTALASAIQTRVILRLADENDYMFLGAPRGILDENSPAGRGMLRGREIQVALLGAAVDTQAQGEAMRAFAASMTKAGVTPAAPIRRLPDKLAADELPTQVDGLPVLGLSSADLGPWTFDPRGGFVVAGPPGSGRTTAVASIVRALQRQDPGWRAVLLTARRAGLADRRGLWTQTAQGAEAVGALAATLSAELKAADGRQRGGVAKLAIVLESISDFVNGPADAALTELVNAAIAEDLFVVAESEVSTLGSNFGLLGSIKASRRGLALQPDSGDGPLAFRTDFPPRLRRAAFPPGRGFLVGLGRVELGQVFDPDLSTGGVLPTA